MKQTYFINNNFNFITNNNYGTATPSTTPVHQDLPVAPHEEEKMEEEASPPPVSRKRKPSAPAATAETMKRQRTSNAPAHPLLSVFEDPSVAIPCKFDTVAGDRNVPIMGGLYPPVGSVPERPWADRTNFEVRKALGDMDLVPNWVDLVPFAPAQSNKEVDQWKLRRIILKDPKHAMEWGARVVSLVTEGSVIYICGETANLAWEMFSSRSEATLGEGKCVWKCGGLRVMRFKNFYVVVGGIHPSAHMMSGGKSGLTKRFNDAMRLVEVLLKLQPGEDIQKALDEAKSAKQKVFSERTAELVENGATEDCLAGLDQEHDHVWENVKQFMDLPIAKGEWELLESTYI